MNTLWQDLRYGLRTLCKNPGFTAVAVLSLGLGIGLNSSVFSVVCAYLYRNLNYKHAAEIIDIEGTNRELAGTREISVPDFLDWRDQNSVFAELAATKSARFGLAAEGASPDYVVASRVTPNYFSFLGVVPALGRDFRPQEDRPGQENVVIVPHALWQAKFGSDPDLIGKTIMLSGRPFSVVGILPSGAPAGFRQVFVPLSLDSTDLNAAARGNRNLSVMGKLKPGITLERAQAEMENLARRLEQAYPDSHRGWGVQLIPRVAPLEQMMHRAVSHEDERGRMLLLLLVAVGFVLLISCVNVASLLAIRATVREKELALRCALGASRMRLIRQLLTESLLLALLGGVTGVLLAAWGSGLIATFWRVQLPEGVDGQVVTFTGSITLGTVVVFGLIPAWLSARRGPLGALHQSLKEGGRTSDVGSASAGLRSALVVSEISLALVLLIGAGLMIKSFVLQSRIDPGFDPQKLLAVRYHLVHPKFAQDERKAEFFRQTLEQVEALSGVESAAWVDSLPAFSTPTSHRIRMEGAPAFTASSEQPRVNYRAVTEAYFQTLGVRVLRGRDFGPADAQAASRVAIINEPMARRFWPNTDPIGKYVSVDAGSRDWLQVVGIVPTTMSDDLRKMSRPEPEIIELSAVPSEGPWLLVRTASEPLALVDSLRVAVFAVDKDTPVANIQVIERVIPESMDEQRSLAQLLSCFAGIALILATVGLYGVMAYSVTRQTKEIGIRVALGAQGRDVLKLVVGQALKLVLVSIAAGLAGAFVLTRLIAHQLYGVTPTDPATFAGISIFLGGVALVASYIPARRATKVDPMVALRYE